MSDVEAGALEDPVSISSRREVRVTDTTVRRRTARAGSRELPMSTGWVSGPPSTIVAN
jgi:hypothetical protein